MQSIWWFVAASALGAIEIFTLDLTFLMLASGAIAGGVVVLAGGPLWLAFIIALAVSTVMMLALRPWLLRSLRVRGVKLVETNAAALTGSKGRTIDPVTDIGGRIKLRGEVWSARTQDDADAIGEGVDVTVIRIAGATAIVVPEQEHNA